MSLVLFYGAYCSCLVVMLICIIFLHPYDYHNILADTYNRTWNKWNELKTFYTK